MKRQSERVARLMEVYGLLTPVLTLVPFGYGYGMPHLLFPLTLTVLLSGLWLIGSRPSAVSMVLPLVLIVLIGTFGAISTGTPARLLGGVSIAVVVSPALLPFAASTEASQRILSRFRSKYVLGLSISCLIGILLAIAQVEIRDGQQTLFLGDGSGLVLRAGGLVGNSGGFGAASAALVVLTLITPLAQRRRLPRSEVFGAIAGLAGLVLSSNRAALVAVAAAAFFALCLRPIAARVLLIRMSALLVVGAFAALSSAAITRQIAVTLVRFDVLNLTGSSAFLQSSRRETWPVVLDRIGDSPVTGTALQDLSLSKPIDNVFLSVTAEWGLVVSFFAAVWLLGAALSLFYVRGDSAGFGGLVMLVCLVVLGAFLDIQRSWFVLPPLLLFITASQNAGMENVRRGPTLASGGFASRQGVSV